MVKVEINCLQYQDLVIVVEDNLTLDKMQKIKLEAQRLLAICDSRMMGGDCAGGCPMAHIGTASLEEIHSAINSAFSK